ncbi:AAA family ATPase [Pseudanabaena sp. PCC 6802]|uniref:AAA family ATPase n=1 Tax=Pseudanabaena sp. PCC 6802 TaxID=118173 RepID=UPI00034D5F22
MDLFEQNRQRLTEQEAPLAARMRPRSLDDFIGQSHILGAGRLLRRAIQADRLSSLIFYGPPGTGKTTLARIIANTTHAHFIAINAVLSGVKEIRAAIEAAQEQQGVYSRRTILFVDEVHRFNKAQQDALLPWVENGTIVLIGATTENPFFEVNKALVSRSRLFQLKPLDLEDLRRVAATALSDPERGYGQKQIDLESNALEHLVNIANGDARALLNALELAVETTPSDATGVVRITLEVAEESIQRRAVLYDKEGDAHFDTISAFIKSLRGSDPDAALYWLARMTYAGEDPHFIFRRMLILASEDVGLADPQAVVVVNACAEAFDRVGLPEGRYHLAQATLYLANAPKSNSVMGFFDAIAIVEKEQQADIPNPLKDASRDRQGFGHGAGYLYPHAYRDHWVAQQYLPASLQGQVFYQPSDRGAEAQIADRVARQREAQLATFADNVKEDLPEGLTLSPPNAAVERWLKRTIESTGEKLAAVRDRLFERAKLQRHHVVLDLNAGSGLLTWEAIRQVPEGGVYACTYREAEADTLRDRASALPELTRPRIFTAAIAELPNTLAKLATGIRFDRIVGHNALMREADKSGAIAILAKFLLPEGAISLHEAIPLHTQRIYRLLETNSIEVNLKPKLYDRWVEAEEAIYQQASDPMLNWDAGDLERGFTENGLSVQMEVETNIAPMYVTPDLIDRWFGTSETKPTYSDRLRHKLSHADVKSIRDLLALNLMRKSVPWQSTSAFAIAKYHL